jgi:hypothetical protein
VRATSPPYPTALNTHDEALRVRDYGRAYQVRRITVATITYYTARTRWTFRRVLRGTGVEVVALVESVTESNSIGGIEDHPLRASFLSVRVLSLYREIRLGSHRGTRRIRIPPPTRRTTADSRLLQTDSHLIPWRVHGLLPI